MKRVLDCQFLYFVAPILLSTCALFVFYNTPISIVEGVASLVVPIVLLYAVGRVFIFRGLGVYKAAREIQYYSGDKVVMLTLSGIILILGPLDIYVNGLKILAPSTYAEFHGAGRYIRHISSLCWVLIPVAYIFFSNSKIKWMLIFYALVFPILIVDRNRLLISVYVLLFCFLVYLNNFKNIKFKIIAVVSVVFLIFAAVGAHRSGAAFAVDSSGEMMVHGYFPLKNVFFSLPSFLQQIILYITTPIFNFATIYSDNFTNQDFLMSQLSPFSRDLFEKYPFSPVLVPRFNVGTEFFPFLLYGGIGYVYLALVFMYISFIFSVIYFRYFKSIFSLLIFFKISHTILFMGFAPQFFILLNLGFIIFILLLSFFAIIISNFISIQKT